MTISEEYREFKRNIMDKGIEEVFNQSYKIHFYNNVCDYLEAQEKVEDDITLARLYDFYIKYEYLTVDSYTGIEELIKEYKKHMERKENKDEILFT